MLSSLVLVLLFSGQGFSQCFTNAGCTGDQVPAVSQRECCVETNTGLSYNDGGTCSMCIVLNVTVTCGIGAVPGQQTFICNSNNRLVSTVCSFDGGPLENCSFPLVVGIGRFGTDNHTVVVTVVDVFGQSLNLSFDFSLVEPLLPIIPELEVTCVSRGVPGSQEFLCGFSNNVESVTCSFDGGPIENCSFPLVVDIEEFGTDNHTLVVIVVDVFGQSVGHVFTFHLTESLPPEEPPVLNVTCGIGAVPGRETFICNSNNRLVSTVCSFDGGPFENCSFPLVVGIDEFGTDNHTLVVTVVDVFGQSVDFVLTFHLTEPLPPAAAPERFEADVGERQVAFSWSPPPVAQRNGLITSYTLSCSPSPSSLPQSPSHSGSLTVTGFFPDTAYSCSVVATNNKGSGPAASITFTTQSDYVYFQLRLEGVIACSELILSSIEQKLADITGAVVEHLMALCTGCDITTDNNVIDKEAFRCFSESPTHITYRARLGGTLETNSSELVSLLEKWVRDGPSVTVSRVIMTVDPKCSVVISSLSEEECLLPPTLSPTTAAVTPKSVTSTTVPVNPNKSVTSITDPPSTMNPEPSVEVMDIESTDQSSSLPDNTPAIIGAVVALIIVVVLIIAISLTIIAIATLKYRHRNLALKHAEKFELTGLPSPAMVEGTAVKTTDNNAYEVMKQGVGEPESGYEMVDTSPLGGPPPADEGEKYDVPASTLCREPLPAMPTVGGAEEPNSLPPVTGGGEEEDGVYEIVPGDK